MKAKELKVMASRDFSEVSAVDKIIYMFNDETFTAFTAQLCREQREICAFNFIEWDGDKADVQYQITNAPMPEI